MKKSTAGLIAALIIVFGQFVAFGDLATDALKLEEVNSACTADLARIDRFLEAHADEDPGELVSGVHEILWDSQCRRVKVKP